MDVRRAGDRGLANFGWLHSRHTFSFGSYLDPQQVGFSDLLVINDDRVSPGRGFDTHGHRDMEIFSYVLDGGLQHRDSMGTGSVIRPGDGARLRDPDEIHLSDGRAAEVLLFDLRPNELPSY